MGYSRPLFSLFSSFQYTMFNINKVLPMTGFEPGTSGIGSDRSTNWAKTTAQKHFYTLETQFGGNGGFCGGGVWFNFNLFGIVLSRPENILTLVRRKKSWSLIRTRMWAVTNCWSEPRSIDTKCICKYAPTSCKTK